MANNNQFFNERTDQSFVKAQIVSKYFWAWAKVMIGSAKKNAYYANKGGNRIAYIDLFAGPGRYKDGSKSTPLLILEQAIKVPDMRERLVTMFNDIDEDNVRSLETEIQSLPGIHTLKYPPHVYNHEVGTEIVKMFEEMELVPTLFFVDPWGYKGLSLKLINSVLRNWGCDCIFFFNYNRINMGLLNPVVEEHMKALFGDSRAIELRKRLELLSPYERELTIVEEIAEALKEMGGKYVLPFGFTNDQGTRTTHHLIFVSKHFRGYDIMKEIMARESSKSVQGVATFTYSPADRRQPLLFELTRPLDALEEMLLHDFAGRSITLEQIYETHSVGKPYIKKNYRDAFRNLEACGKIVPSIPAAKRPKRKGEVSVKGVIYTFPYA
jgi:three-Cys-motif partner protein